MGKPTGFLDYQRHSKPQIPVAKRIQNYHEFYLPLPQSIHREQGARCMNCGVPFCQSAMALHGRVVGCPLHNLIPEWNDEIYHNHLSHALSRLLKTNNFPEFTSRVCPALCEKACLAGMDDEPVTIHDNENYIIETAFSQGLMKPRVPAVRSGKKVCVIGSGPSGLSVADELNHRGHLVTVYEKEDRIGGLLMYGIPNMKLDKQVIMRRQKIMAEEGVSFMTGVDVGKDISFEYLAANYDAIILCCGVQVPRELKNVNVSEINGAVYAVDYLTMATKSLLDHKKGMSAKGKHVVIVGGGDTGNDCVATAIRQGCQSVTQLEMMPCPPKTRQPDNPWPEWPMVLKTDYGVEEAIEVFGHDPRIFETTVKEVVTAKKKITAIQTVRVAFQNGKVCEIPGSENTLKCDLLIIAAGFTGVPSYITEHFSIDQSQRNYHVHDQVFMAGDMRRGQSLVVWAIAEGRACAREVDYYLMGYTTMR